LQAEAQTRIALAAYLPNINGTGMATHHFLTETRTNPPSTSPVTVPPSDYLSGNIQLQQALINVPAFDQIGIDKVSEKAARLGVDAEKRVLVQSVAGDVVSVVTAERLAEINRVGLRVALEQVEIAQQKHSLGIATGLDVVRAKQNAANARATLVT